MYGRTTHPAAYHRVVQIGRVALVARVGLRIRVPTDQSHTAMKLLTTLTHTAVNPHGRTTDGTAYCTAYCTRRRLGRGPSHEFNYTETLLKHHAPCLNDNLHFSAVTRINVCSGVSDTRDRLRA
jgi:hypothetical protein